MNKAWLAHHGIKGQKWGVRNGPPYPIEDKVLRKGTVLNSVSNNFIDTDSYINSGKAIYTYNPNDKWDKKVYEGPFTVYKAQYQGARFMAVHQFEVQKDLLMPTRKERVQEFKDLYDDPKMKKTMVKELDPIRKMLVQHNVGENVDGLKNLNLSKLQTIKDVELAYEVFNHAMEAHYRYKCTSQYMKNMSNKYDAMVDDNNALIYNDVHDPVIIFKAKEALKKYGNTPVKYLTWNEVQKNYADVQQERAKKGKGVML